ncbi:MAG: acyl carrier protein [Moorea sp. SIOASIH]|uniref:acyl carrier protein n=1 Tax=Moorena sp. SIOASIH TaxID=2607817 RepID=UPI0013B8A0E4|nr:acyl carrier protein [Moorena sp. SIOASIH]NEO37002.1 acyl carrier protein [Moorena sp. SIOASIH]
MPSVSEINQENFEDEPKTQSTVSEIQDWLVSYLAELLEIAPNKVDVKKPFERYGLDSSTAIGLTGELEQWLGYEIEPTLLFDYPTIEAVAQHLANQ